jgi:hypothetical protein
MASTGRATRIVLAVGAAMHEDSSVYRGGFAGLDGARRHLQRTLKTTTHPSRYGGREGGS